MLRKDQQNWQTQLGWLRKREKIQVPKIRSASVDITTNPPEIKRILRDYYQKLYTNKLNNLDEIDKILPPKLTHEENLKSK